jgi:translation initiation factor IF-2
LNDNVLLTSEILDLSAQIEILNDNEDVYNEIIKTNEEEHQKLIIDFRNLIIENQKLIIENKKIYVSVPEVKIKKINKYQEFVKENFKKFKNDNPDITHQKIFKLLASKWKVTN